MEREKSDDSYCTTDDGENPDKEMVDEDPEPLTEKVGDVVPAKLREETGDVLYLTISMERCLCGYSETDWQELSGKVSAMPYVRQRKMRPLFSNAAKCELDAQGRVLIPQHLRQFAGLDKNITVVGCNNHIEFWDSDSWQKIFSEEILPENIAAVLEELEF